MAFPRNTSSTSLVPPAIEVLSCNNNVIYSSGGQNKPKTPTQNRKLLSSFAQSGPVQPAQMPSIVILPSAANYQPNRKREEQCVLQNLRKRVEALNTVKVRQNSVFEEAAAAKADSQPVDEALFDDDRPQFFQKILNNRPVTMVLDSSDLRTAWQDSDFITDCLCWHNVYRERHAAPPLTMSSELCFIAQTWANHLAHTDKFYYRIDKDLGQNLFCRPSNGLQSDVTGQEVAFYWYNAGRQYDFDREPDILHANVNAGHFTQLVWVNSRYFGVGKATSRSGKVLVVAHYEPPGNISGLFHSNVLPPISDLPIPRPVCRTRIRLVSDASDTTKSSTSSLE